MKLGDAFVMSVPDKGDHLFFVISDPGTHEGSFVVANITGDWMSAGKECILDKGDHPWIIKQSFMYFGEAREITPELEKKNIQVLIQKGMIKMHSPLKPEVLTRIVEAAKQSKTIAVKLKKYL